MGLFDSLFGSDTVETSSETDSKVRFPQQFRNLATSVGQMADELAGRDPNKLIAGFSPDQLAAFQALRDMATTDPTGYFGVIQQLQDEGLSAGDNAALTSGLTSLTNLITTSQNDPAVSTAIDSLLQQNNVGDINAEQYRPGVATDTVSASPYSTAAIEDTMSPYRDQVIDRFTTDFNAQADRTRAASARERAGRRAFGSRGDLAETEEDRNLTDSYSKALTGLLESGFTNAQGQFNTNTGVSVDTQKANQAARLQAGLAGQGNALTAEQANQGKDLDLAKLRQSGAQGAGALALDRSKLGGDLSSSLAAAGIDQSKLGLAGAQAAGDAASQERATAIGNAGLVSSVGDAYQNQQQKALDAPWTQLDRAAGVLAGVPTTASSTTTGTQPSGAASPISQLAGAGLAAYGIYQGSADGGVVGGLDRDVLSARGLKRMMADGGQVGVKEQEPGLGERDPRFAWSLTDDTLDAKEMGFDINDPSFYDGELAADVGANPFYSVESVPGDYRYSNQLPAWGAMPMLPENDMTWQLMEGMGDGKARSMRGMSEAMSRKLMGNPYYGASIDDLAKVLDNPKLPEKLRDAALEIVQMYVHLDEFADGGAIEGYDAGGTIGVNPFATKTLSELIDLLGQTSSMTNAQISQLTEAIRNKTAVSGGLDTQAEDDLSAAEELQRIRGAGDQYFGGLEQQAILDGAQEGDSALEQVRQDRALNEAMARDAGVTARTPQIIPSSEGVIPQTVFGANELPGLRRLSSVSDVAPMPGFSIKGMYEAQRGGVPFSPSDPRYKQPRSLEELTTGIPLIDTATAGELPPPAPMAARGTYGYPGAPAFDPRMGGAPSPYGTDVAAPTAGGLDFTQPGSMVQAAALLTAGPTPTGAPSPSSSAAALATVPPSGSPSPRSLGGNGTVAPPFTPPIPMRPPGMDAASPATPLDDSDWLSGVMNNPYFQLGIAMMGSTKQGLLPAFADAASQVSAQRAAQAEAEYKRQMAERGMLVDEGGLALKQQALAADIAATAARGAGGGRGRGGGGGGGGGSGGGTGRPASTTAMQRDIQYLVDVLHMDPMDAMAVVNNEKRPGEAGTAAAADYLIDDKTALEMATASDPDWAMLPVDEQVRRLDAYRRGQNPTAGGFGGLGGLDFYGATAAPPPGFALNP